MVVSCCNYDKSTLTVNDTSWMEIPPDRALHKNPWHHAKWQRGGQPGAPRHQLHVWQAADWLAVPVTGVQTDPDWWWKGGKKKKPLGSGRHAKMQTTSPTVRGGLNTVARETNRGVLGLALSCGEGDRSLGWTACSWYGGFPLCCWASKRTGSKRRLLLAYYCYYARQ